MYPYLLLSERLLLTSPQILQNEQDTWKALVRYVRENDVDCDLWVGDTLDVPMTPEVAVLAKENFERYTRAGGKVDHIKVTQDPAEASKVLKHRYGFQVIKSSNSQLTDHSIERCEIMLCMAGINFAALETHSSYHAFSAKEIWKQYQPANAHSCQIRLIHT